MAFGRFIATKPRTCTECEDTIEEGQIFTKIADLPVCLECEAYRREHPVDNRKRF